MPPLPLTAYLSVDPLEPVFVFRSEADAKEYQTYHNGLARIYRDRPRPFMPPYLSKGTNESAESVYLPLPPGLDAVRTSRRGDVAFEFKSAIQAEEFERVIKVGRRLLTDGLHGERYRRTVYVGKELIR